MKRLLAGEHIGERRRPYARGVLAKPIAPQTTSKILAIYLDLCDNCLRKHRVLLMNEHGEEEDSHAGTLFPDWDSVI